MIEVKNLTKWYPGKLAVDDISFHVERGEIVGFLGPNGAGKTTTMRCLCGYTPTSAGVVQIAGFDVFSQSLQVRRNLGYLPENVPLYNEMRIDEYLRFRAQIKGVTGRKCKIRMGEVKELCGLSNEGRLLISHLSKGYRQRVGLADALIGSPELLILDEPTIGLDPNQIRTVRDLIKNLGGKHTVLLSTHILSEVEMTCKRVLIIKEGKIIASDTPANLRSRFMSDTHIIAEIHAPHDRVEEKIRMLPHVRSVSCEVHDTWSRYEIECNTGVDLRLKVFELAVHEQWKLRELRIQRSSLEEVFIALTKQPHSTLQPISEKTQEAES